MSQQFTESFKRKIRERDQYRCLICGQETKFVCHIEHRGSGGDDSKNTEDNCLLMCQRHHDQVDRRRKPWMRIDGFEPNNELLEVSVYEYGEWRPLDSRYLDYYRR